MTSHPEVELALMLARTIDAIQADPDQLRSAIYELARQKLRDQFTGIDPPEAERLSAALEVAIHGVEAHAQKDQQRSVAAVMPDRLPAPPALDLLHRGGWPSRRFRLGHGRLWQPTPIPARSS